MKTESWNRFNGKCEVIRVKVSPFSKVARLLVRLDQVASVIVNANHGIVSAAVELCVAAAASQPWIHAGA
jgi:hypothetical protein